MITTSFYLDTRAVKPGAEAPLKISVTKDGSTAYIKIGLSISPRHWNKEFKKVVSHPRKTFLNTYLQQKKLEVDEIVLTLMKTKGHSSMSVTQVKNHILEILNQNSKPKTSHDETTTVKYWYEKWMEYKSGSTKTLYEVTKRRIISYIGEEAFSKLHFEDITKDWLVGFDKHMAKTASSANTRAISMRNLRTVCNYAIDNDVTNFYPFRRFKIETQQTRKRSFDVETLRLILNHKCEEEWQEKYLDFFRLTFFLIGINCKDLFNLEYINKDRVEYIRAKTRKLYSIKVEPEAKEIFERLKGEKKLLGCCETYVSHRHFFNNLCKGLKAIKDQLGIAELTTYWARHSWATIAASLDIPKETIAHALGHGEYSVTDIYISFDYKKVDDANRKVLDWVLYNKK